MSEITNLIDISVPGCHGRSIFQILITGCLKVPTRFPIRTRACYILAHVISTATFLLSFIACKNVVDFPAFQV